MRRHRAAHVADPDEPDAHQLSCPLARCSCLRCLGLGHDRLAHAPAHVVRQLQDDLVDLLGRELAGREATAELDPQRLEATLGREHPHDEQAPTGDVERGARPHLGEELLDERVAVDMARRKERQIAIDLASRLLAPGASPAVAHGRVTVPSPT